VEAYGAEQASRAIRFLFLHATFFLDNAAAPASRSLRLDLAARRGRASSASASGRRYGREAAALLPRANVITARSSPPRGRHPALRRGALISVGLHRGRFANACCDRQERTPSEAALAPRRGARPPLRRALLHHSIQTGYATLVSFARANAERAAPPYRSTSGNWATAQYSKALHTV